MMHCAADDFDTYLLEFPPKATEVERALLLTALFSMDFAAFSGEGGESLDRD